MSSVSRRRVLEAGAAAAAGLSLGRVGTADATPLASSAGAARPTVIASANGLRGVARAHEMLMKGADPLDAAIAGVNIQELDPEEQSVGGGGRRSAGGAVRVGDASMPG